MIRWIVIFIALLSSPVLASNKVSTTSKSLIWHWEDSFTQAQQHTSKTWITQTHHAITRNYGDFPFPIHIYFHAAKWPSEPVPWANTERNDVQGIHFHVDKNATLNEYLEDWTAPHEMSHLLIPYLGTRNRWFAEGFASYMQYKIMVELNVLTEKQKWQKYMFHIGLANTKYSYSTLPFTRAAERLAHTHQYPTLYWGGANYFLHIESLLHDEGKSFDALLKRYLACCRLKPSSRESVISTLDALSESTVFQDTFNSFSKEPGFPEYINHINKLKKTH